MALSRSVTEAVGGMMDSLGMGKKKTSATQVIPKGKDTTKYTKPSTMGDVLTTALGKTDVMSNPEKVAYKKAVQ